MVSGVAGQVRVVLDLVHGICSATVGATPVKRWTCAASATFSYGPRGTPFWAKTLARPELPNAHDGSSIRCVLRADATVAPSERSRSWSPSPHPRAASPRLRQRNEGRVRRAGESARRTPRASTPCHRFRLVSITLLTVPIWVIYGPGPKPVRYCGAAGRTRAVLDARPRRPDRCSRKRQRRIARLVEEHGRGRVGDLAARSASRP